MKIQCDVPLNREGAEHAARNNAFRRHLVDLAAHEMNQRASERQRKIAEEPRLVDTFEGPLGDYVLLRFEAQTISL